MSKNEAFLVRLPPEYHSYARVTSCNDETKVAIYSDEVNQLLATKTVHMHVMTDTYDAIRTEGTRIDAGIYKTLVRKRLRSPESIHNEKKVRLVTDLTVEGIQNNRILQVQKTDYFSGLCTNEAIYEKITSGDIEIFDGMKMLCGADRLLHPLRTSPCSNHIGVSTIAFAPGGQLLVTRQTKQSAQSAGLLAPTGSGSADWKDIVKMGRSNNFQDFLIRSVRRELLQECGLNKRTPVPTIVIGYTRLLHRAGKPDFYCLSFLDIDPAKLKTTFWEREYVAGYDVSRFGQDASIKNFIKHINTYQRANESTLSLILQMNFEFLKKFIVRNPERFLKALATMAFD